MPIKYFSALAGWMVLAATILLFAGTREARAARYCGCTDSQGRTPSYDLSGSDADFQKYCRAACSSRPGTPSAASGSTGGTAGAVLQVLPGLMGIFSAPSSSSSAAREKADIAAAEAASREREREAARASALAASRVEDQLAQARDSLPNPWAQGKDSSSAASSGTPNRAPLLTRQCVSIVHKNTGGVSEGLWRAVNGCGFPVQVIHCLYDDARQPKCGLKSEVGWGVTDTIPAGAFHYIPSALPPASTKVWYFACDMRKGGLCLKPGAATDRR